MRVGGPPPFSALYSFIIALAFGSSGSAYAQSASPVPSPTRTGPDATTPSLPSFAKPPAPTPRFAPVSQDDARAVTGISDLRLIRVRISADANGRTAIPPKNWTPPLAASQEASLVHRPGQPLDLQWVQSQFDRHVQGGIRPSTAVALIQSINRAFVTAGFVNSGLLVSRQTNADPEVIDLQLVYGRLFTSEAAGPAVAVQWPTGASGLTEDYVRDRFPSSERQPLNALELERDFRLLTEDPMIQTVSASLRPGTRPGEAALQLLIHPAQRFDLYTGAANDRSPSVGGDRVFAGGYLRSSIFSGDTLSAEVGRTKGVQDAQVAYSTPFLSPRNSLSLRAGLNNAAVIDRPLQPLDIEARDRHAELAITRRILRRPLMGALLPGRWTSSQTLTVGASLFYRKQRSFLLGEPFSFAPGSVNGRTEYKAARLTADYVRRNVAHVVALSITGTLGLGGTQSDIESVPNPADHFSSVLGQLNFAKRLGGALELRGRLVGQYSGGTLYSGERLSIGGANSVRGYRESLFLVERGIIGSLELARPFRLWGRRARGGVDAGAFTASIFADGAAFRNAVAPQPDSKVISSIGASLAWTPSDAFSAIGSYGHALNDVETSQQSKLQDKGFHFRVVVHPLGIVRGRPGRL